MTVEYLCNVYNEKIFDMLRHTWRYRLMKIGQISEIALFIPKCGTLDPLTEAASNDVTMMTSWWITSGMLRM